jgi:uncharacterized protein (DUF58 family)
VKRAAAAVACATGAGAVAGIMDSLAVLALAIGFVLLVTTAWLVIAASARWVGVERRLGRTEVQEDGSISVCFTVRGPTWLPIRVEAEDHAGGWVEVPRSGLALELGVPRPGMYWLGQSRIRWCDTIGMFERRGLAGHAHRLLILPAPRAEPHVYRLQSDSTDDPEPQGLKPYAPGMPLTRIHWPSLARGAGLQARHLAPPPDRLPLLVVDIGGATRLEALDWAVRVAAGRILRLARTGGCRVLLPGETTPTSVIGVGGDWRRLHRRLATLASDGPACSGPPSPAIAGTIRVRAVDAPAALPPAPPLPRGVVSATGRLPACV